jgi:dinuclear metal center YbgI/SA1388 family protein
MNRTRLVNHLNEYLKIGTISDSSLNGLQVEGAASVRRVAVAVDACLKTIRAASRWNADMLITHHGLFWSRNERITGVMKKRVAALIERKLSLYAVHLPLDCHEEVGNNVELVRLLGLRAISKFGEYRGTVIGILAEADGLLTRRGLAKRLQDALKTTPKILAFGPNRVRKLGIISGGAAEYVAESGEYGCDTFVTGETSHVAYNLAREARINLVYAGHYASETVGVKALARHIEQKYALETRFISAPTGY